MQVFRGCVEITSENAVLGLRAGHLNEFSNARIGLTDAARGEFAKAGGRRCDESARANGSNYSDLEKSSKNQSLSEPKKRCAAWFGFANHKCCAPRTRNHLEGSEIRVEMGDGLDAAEIILQRDVLIGGVGVFVG